MGREAVISEQAGFKIFYATDMEGSHIDTFAPASENFEVLLDHGAHIVFGGDFFDKGQYNITNLKRAVSLKERYPQKVTLILGNRDLNKLRFLRELNPEFIRKLAADQVQNNHNGKSFVNWLRENGITLNDDNIEAQYLKWLFPFAMGIPNETGFENFRKELKREDSGATHDDKAVVAYIKQNYCTPGCDFYKLLKNGRINTTEIHSSAEIQIFSVHGQPTDHGNSELLGLTTHLETIAAALDINSYKDFNALQKTAFGFLQDAAGTRYIMEGGPHHAEVEGRPNTFEKKVVFTGPLRDIFSNNEEGRKLLNNYTKPTVVFAGHQPYEERGHALVVNDLGVPILLVFGDNSAKEHQGDSVKNGGVMFELQANGVYKLDEWDGKEWRTSYFTKDLVSCNEYGLDEKFYLSRLLHLTSEQITRLRDDGDIISHTAGLDIAGGFVVKSYDKQTNNYTLEGRTGAGQDPQFSKVEIIMKKDQLELLLLQTQPGLLRASQQKNEALQAQLEEKEAGHLERRRAAAGSSQAVRPSSSREREEAEEFDEPRQSQDQEAVRRLLKAVNLAKFPNGHWRLFESTHCRTIDELATRISNAKVRMKKVKGEDQDMGKGTRTIHAVNRVAQNLTLVQSNAIFFEKNQSFDAVRKNLMSLSALMKDQSAPSSSLNPGATRAARL